MIMLTASGRKIGISSIKSLFFTTVRHQSSFTFFNNRSLQKTQMKQSKKQVEKRSENPPNQQLVTQTPKNVSLEHKQDYSWLPKAPITPDLVQKDIDMSIFYAGYRPLFIAPIDCNNSQSKIYEFAMKLEALDGSIPWINSATGSVCFTEWDGVPLEVIKALKPFHPPKLGKENDRMMLLRIKRETILKEQEKLTNRPKGRKKPILKLIELRKKFQE